MIIKCKNCGEQIEYLYDCTAMLRCNKCGNYEVIFSDDAKIKCSFCDNEQYAMKNKNINVLCGCSLSTGVGGRGLWQVKLLGKKYKIKREGYGR